MATKSDDKIVMAEQLVVSGLQNYCTDKYFVNFVTSTRQMTGSYLKIDLLHYIQRSSRIIIH